MVDYNKFRLKIILLCYVSGIPIGMFSLYMFQLYTDIFNHKVWMEIAITYAIYILLIIYIFIELKKQNINLKMLRRSNKQFIPLKEQVMALVAPIIITIMMSILFFYIIGISRNSAEDTLSNTRHNNSTIVPIIIGIRTVVLTPIIEEIIVRGIIYERLRIKYHVRKALIFSSLLFGIFHIGALPIPEIISGLMFGAWYIKTKSLKTSILVHMLYNFLAVTGALNFLLIPLGMLKVFTPSQESVLCIVVVLVLTILMISYLVVRYVFVTYKNYFDHE